jgi:chorismate mutase
MLKEIEFRKETYSSDFQSELDRLRGRLDNLDRELLEVLAARMNIVEQLGEHKRDNNVAVLQLDRWKNVHTSRVEWGNSLNLYGETVEELFKLIHMESIRKQTEVMNSQPA